MLKTRSGNFYSQISHQNSQKFMLDGYPSELRPRQSDIMILGNSEQSALKLRQASTELFQVSDGALKTHIQAIVQSNKESVNTRNRA